MEEEWKPIPGYEGYEVSNHGRVRSLDRTVQLKDGRTRRQKGRALKPWVIQGYLYVSLYKGRKVKKKRIHRLVLEAFVGPCPEGMECLHGDGNPANNRLDNLRWASPSDNNLDTVKHGRHHNANKAHCPRGHEFIPENRVKSQEAKGKRNCLACNRARRYVHHHPELSDQIQEIADQYYEAILKECIDDPVIARSRDAREIMNRRRAEQRNEQQ